VLGGERGEGEEVGFCIDEELGGGGELALQLFDDAEELRPHLGGIGAGRRSCARGVATIAWAAFGTRVRRLRMAWVLQRCQLAPVSTAAMAFFSPSWASETTRATPERPRATRPLKNAVQRLRPRR